MSLIDDLLMRFQEQQDSANAANEARYQEGLGIYNDVIEQYSPGGSYGAGGEYAIEQGAKQAVAQGTQTAVSSGLSSTSTRGNLRKKYERDVAGGQRLSLNDLRQEKLSQSLTNKAGFIERRTDVGPSSDTIASLAKSAGSSASESGGGSVRYTTIGKNRVSAGAIVADGKLFSSTSDRDRYLRMKGLA